ncbi:MAG: DUF4041 domain-containing protein [Phycisphaerales bacterium]|nr:DUF4041 domain-containing protein [Phycisphaerales bacterium]
MFLLVKWYMAVRVARRAVEAHERVAQESAQVQAHLEREVAAAHAAGATALAEGKAKAKALFEDAQTSMAASLRRADQIIADAEKRALEIAGKAYDAVQNASMYEQTARAMKNIIEGYGDEYLVPAESLLDELAEEFSHADAGRHLKEARDHVKGLIKAGLASRCEYVEVNRREGAERFVLDAFNGKTDSILSRVRHDNAGKLEQEIKDAFNVVNFGGRAFREARITDQYLAARLQELRWAAVAQELKRREQEEQRRVRDQIREEEKARREFERAIRDSAKEEEMLRKAMAKAEAQVAAASADQRAKIEAQLADLRAKLVHAEEKNRRAISMAQQTRKGHVYIISNVGSFGDHVYKIGLTRRLDPLDRIWELGDASVPFDFDVHAMILSEDAPKLENDLHKHFLLKQINKVNYRKEFFRVSLAEIRRELQNLGIEAKWTMTAEAMEYRETLAIERAIEADPAAREAWINRQLTLDPTDHPEPVVEAME